MNQLDTSYIYYRLSFGGSNGTCNIIMLHVGQKQLYYVTAEIYDCVRLLIRKYYLHQIVVYYVNNNTLNKTKLTSYLEDKAQKHIDKAFVHLQLSSRPHLQQY